MRVRVAARVSIFTVPEYDGDRADPGGLVEYLFRHGIGAEVAMPPHDATTTGIALIDAATERKATLIVMGAYTHSRLRQGFFGGVTRQMLVHGSLPLLMSH